MTRAKLVNLSVSVFFILFSIWIIKTGWEMGAEEGTFPLMVGVFQLIVALFQLYFDLQGNNHVNKFEESNVWKVIEATAVMLCYVYLLKKIGYIIDTTLLSIYLMLTLGYRRIKIIIPASIGFTLVVFVVFKVCLRVPLPMVFFDF